MTGKRTSGSPWRLPRGAWAAVLRRTLREAQADNLTDWAAALTYYGVLSLFPVLLVLVAVLGLLGDAAVRGVRNVVRDVVPAASARDILLTGIDQVQGSTGTAGVVAVLGILGAFWTASGYLGAFTRAANVIYDVPEGRPLARTLLLRVGLTALVGLLVLVSLVLLVFSGRLSAQLGRRLGVGEAGVTAWDIGKWPVLVLLVSLIFAVLYWAAPNVRQRFRWISPGGVFAVLVWAVVSAGFALYVSYFASYNRTYGSLAGVIVFLVWLWLSNVAILLGAELSAELERERTIRSGGPADREPYVSLRDDRKLRKRDRD
ncbi:YihY/virulence factor BrkB family protein [Micromonospora sp. WMMD1102]|uniref:YihY/virulence factor BrkB family protein n=1 Tax=Micromonospora sp. WMMD1102 TaxID=3016105 RepID=UPI002415581F|nr:YihY/virulence factor BrkB family protein [Micromonospora sp. WMMD1102]MDG4789163.1 YihY/virulence factor BrkB family protein [Micromonospora sp. WMMD1102]